MLVFGEKRLNKTRTLVNSRIVDFVKDISWIFWFNVLLFDI